jgi:general nucleoside transport system permease protein
VDGALIDLVGATLRVATPLILCAMGGLFSERGGVVDIGLEGKMLAGAFAAGAVGALTGSALAGLGAAVAVAAALALVHAVVCVSLAGNQIVSGVAINLLASGLTAVLGAAWFHQGGQTPSLPDAARFLAPRGMPGGLHPLVLVALASVPLVHLAVTRSRFGLRLRAVGEAPQAVEAAGLSVAGLRIRAVLLCGVFTGIAGSVLSQAQNAGFTREMSAGQGYIALAALIFGKWRPFGALGACLMFGAFDVAAIRLQGVAVPGLGAVPGELVQALPYVLTVILLAGFIGRATPPRALGTPYRGGGRD